MLEPQVKSDAQLAQRIMERDRFAVLLHLHTRGHFDAGKGLSDERIIRDLGLRPARGEPLLRGLIRAEYLEQSRSGPGLVLTEKGREYVEHGAGRRRSVRF